MGLDVARWEADYHAPATRDEVERDLARARLFGISAVPTLVAQQRYVLTGAQSYGRLKAWLDDVLAALGVGPG